MESTENTQKSESQVIISDEAKSYLFETAKWGNFLAIIGYIGMGFLVLAGIVMAIGLPFLDSSATLEFPFRIMGFFYFLMAGLYFFPVRYLQRFSKSIKQGLLSSSNETVTFAFRNLKSLYRFMGILIIVMFSVYTLAILIAVPIIAFTAR
jgi:hypothetical protein